MKKYIRKVRSSLYIKGIVGTEIKLSFLERLMLLFFYNGIEVILIEKSLKGGGTDGVC